MQEQQLEEAYHHFVIGDFMELYKTNDVQVVYDMVKLDRDACINLMMELEKEIRRT